MWRPVSPATWDTLYKKACDFHNTKLSYKSTATTQWNMADHRRIDVRLAGLIGEALVANELGWTQNLKVMPNGDGGHDFPGLDVKTSTFVTDPHLKVPPEQLKDDIIYVLVAVHMPWRKAQIIGHATGAEVRKAPLRDYGNGPMYCLTRANLTPGLPVVNKV